MRFLIDENLPVSLKNKLLECGYYTIDVRDIGKVGAADREILDTASKLDCILISANYKHFANIILFSPSQYTGIIVVKMPRCSIEEVIKRVCKVINTLKEEEIKNTVIIIEPSRIRKRK